MAPALPSNGASWNSDQVDAASGSRLPRILDSPEAGRATDASRSGTAPRGETMTHAARLSFQSRAAEIMQAAETQFADSGCWVAFYREMLGPAGLVNKTFPTPDEHELFCRGKQFAELQEMVAALRSHEMAKGDMTEPEKMITIRLPQSLHQALTEEGELLNLSINKLCITKLLQRTESRFTPVQQGRRRGRKPGPQKPRTAKAKEQSDDQSENR